MLTGVLAFAILVCILSILFIRWQIRRILQILLGSCPICHSVV